MTEPSISTGSESLKQCCANVYGSDAAKYLLGDSFHPGGLRLTEELALSLELSSSATVLDVASGKGTTALFLAEAFGCRVQGIDLSEENTQEARKHASTRNLSHLADFRLADAEALPFDDATFDAVICECAFCTFPNKKTAASEFQRVLKPGGHVGISDITRDSNPLPDLDGLLAWIACIGDAQPLETYARYLSEAGLRPVKAEQRDHYLQEMVQGIRTKILLAEIMVGLIKLSLPGFDVSVAKAFSNAAQQAIAANHLGYGIVIGVKV